MVASDYIEMKEVPGIPTLQSAPKVVAYGLADAAEFPADVIVVAAKPAAAMLLYEAAVRRRQSRDQPHRTPGTVVWLPRQSHFHRRSDEELYS